MRDAFYIDTVMRSRVSFILFSRLSISFVVMWYDLVRKGLCGMDSGSRSAFERGFKGRLGLRRETGDVSALAILPIENSRVAGETVLHMISMLLFS